jgi:hypothetical protein
MSNNIMDTVAQAVNSLVSALKLPDESAKANDMLGSMNFPQFSRILPYKDYDSATGLFINNKTVGFMFEARPLPGADKDIVATLEHLLRSKLPVVYRSVFISSPVSWSGMISTTVCVSSAGAASRTAHPGRAGDSPSIPLLRATA